MNCVQSHLPVWQALRDELHGQGFEVITVALDSGGAAAAGESIRAAKPEHPSLIDEGHTVATLYNMVNVPTTVWIDEEGRIVRPNEPAWASDASRAMLGTDEEKQRAREQTLSLRQRYLDAVRDWVAKGPASRYALPPEEVLRRMRLPSAEDALAAANFRLGEYLHAQGHAAQAVPFFKEAQRLRPESWTYKRQAWKLGDAERDYGTSFWDEVKALGDRPYYPTVELPEPA